MLDLLYCKCNPFIMTVVDGSIFFKSLTWEKNRRYFYPGITMMNFMKCFFGTRVNQTVKK